MPQLPAGHTATVLGKIPLKQAMRVAWRARKPRRGKARIYCNFDTWFDAGQPVV